MFRKVNCETIIFTLIWVVAISGLITLMSFIEVKKAEQTCSKVEVVLPGNQFFIERAEIDELLNARSEGGLLVGRRLTGINIQKLEDKLKANPFIQFAKVYIDMNGVLHADVKQRVPVLRVFNYTGQDFYIDQEGMKIPTSDHFTSKVLVANGVILESFNEKVDSLKTHLAKGLFKMAKFIAADTLWNEQIVQIYVNNNAEMELVPRVGNQKIIFGNADNMEDKFSNLFLFYKKAIPMVGWDAYTAINLKYKGQVVCLKKDSLLLKNNSIQQLPSDSTNTKLNVNKDSINNIL